MNDGQRDPRPHKPDKYEPKAGAFRTTATVEPKLYADFAKWLDRDLARLESLYKDWATAGYAEWRRLIAVGR